jgi:tetratricopeptide (TPR) repeat protein
MKRLALALCLLPAVAFAQGRTGTTSPGQQAFDEAMRCLNSDDFGCAETKFKEAITLDAGLIDAYWRLATVHYRNKKYPEAVALLRRAPDQTNLDVREQLGLALYKNNNQPEAVKILDGVVSSKPDASAASLQLGQHYYKTEPKKAIPFFESYLKNRTNPALDEQVKLLLGTACLLARDWDQAMRVFEELLKSKPNDLAAKLNLGTAQSGKCQTGDSSACSRCITTYERILGEGPKQPAIYYNLGVCYLRQNRPADAQREADLYTKARGAEAKGWTLLGDSQMEQRRCDKALAAYQTSRNFDKGAMLQCKLGRADVCMKNYDAAIAELEQCTADPALAPEYSCYLVEPYSMKKDKGKLNGIGDRLFGDKKDPKAQKCAGDAYLAGGNLEKAKNAYQNALTAEPNNAAIKVAYVKLLNQLGGVLVEKGENPKALAVLTEAEKLVADDLMTNRNLGLLYLSNKKCVEAEAALRRALNKVPQDITVNRMLGRAYLCQAKRDDARKAYEKAAASAMAKGARGPDLAGVWTELSSLYIESQQYDQAVTVLTEAMKDAGNTPLAQSTQRNLAIAYFERGRATKDKPEQALADIMQASQAPKGTFNAKEMTALACYEWSAALRAGKVQQAEEAIARAKAGGGCNLKPPYDKLGTSFVEAYTQYRDTQGPAKRETAGKTFQQLSTKAPPGSKDWLTQLARSALELAGFDFFQRGDEKRSEALLRQAYKVPAKGETKSIQHNLLAVDVALGRNLAATEKSLEGMGGRPGESLCNIGVIKDRQGDGRGALQYYERCLERVRNGKVKDWIDTKRKWWGGAGGATPQAGTP